MTTTTNDQGTPTERAEQKYPFWLPTGDYETDREDYDEEDAKWQNAEAEMQRQAYIAGAESERAKRPDREQIARAHYRDIYGDLVTPFEDASRGMQATCYRLADTALSSLALEPQAREGKLERLAAVTNINSIAKAMLEEVGYPSHFHPADAPSWAYSVLEEEHEERIEVLEKNLAYEVAQKIKLAEQLQAATATDLTLEQARWKMHAGIDSRCSEEVAAKAKPVIDLVLSSLALEPEAREEDHV